jgi:hypothetical protein
MYGLVLVFLTFNLQAGTYTAAPSKGVMIFPSEDACMTELARALPYQRGKSEAAGTKVNAWCVEIQVSKATGS